RTRRHRASERKRGARRRPVDPGKIYRRRRQRKADAERKACAASIALTRDHARFFAGTSSGRCANRYFSSVNGSPSTGGAVTAAPTSGEASSNHVRGG